MSRRGVSDQGQENQGRNYGNYNREGHYVRDGNYNRDNNFNRSNYGNRNDRSGPYVPPQNREVTPRDGGGSMARVEDMLHKIMRRFDGSDELNKELRNDLARIGNKSIHMQYRLSNLSYNWPNYLRLSKI